MLDALFVCTPPTHHAAPAVAALAARPRGLPREAARALAVPTAQAIVEAWEGSGAVCAVGYQWRSLDVLDELRGTPARAAPGMLVSRSFGPTESARRRDLEGARPTWFADPAAAAASCSSSRSHDIDLQIALAGPVESVQATAASGLLALAGAAASGLDDAVVLLLRFAGGASAPCHVAWTAAQSPPLYALDVHAADVALHLDLDPDFDACAATRMA